MSDHKPILIYLDGVPIKLNKPWRFEQVWLEDEGCHDTVASAWREGEGDLPMGRVIKKVGSCQEKLKRWSRYCFSNITWEIAEKKKQMKHVERTAINGGGGGWGCLGQIETRVSKFSDEGRKIVASTF